MKIGTKVLFILAVCVTIVLSFNLLSLLFSPGAPIYDSGYIFYDYVNDTDFIDVNAPFINVGGRIYYIFKEEYAGSGLEDYCNNIAYIDYKTGIAYTVCDDKKCVHNALNFKRTCELVDFSSNMVIDNEGYIYGSYQDNAFENRFYKRVRDPVYNKFELARYNLYNRSFQTLYIYKQDETVMNSYSNGFALVYPYKNWVYFYEYIVEDGIFETYLRRYNLADNSVETLAKTPIPVSFYVFDRYIYILNDSGLYCYDLDCSDASCVKILDFTDSFFNGKYYACNLQFDSFMKNIYFIKSVSPYYNTSGGTLCYIKSYNYNIEAGVVDRKIHKAAPEDDIYTYQLTFDCVYYTLYDERYIGTYTTFEGDIAEYYDCTDSKVYSYTYTQQADETTDLHVAYDFGDSFVRNFTVIGNYIYGELFGEVKVEAHYDFYKTAYKATNQIRIDMITGETNILKPMYWKLNTSK